jgi:hypothetical protein
VFVSIIGILIRFVPRTITLHPLLTKLSIITLEVSFYLLWMDFMDITRSTFYWLINIKQTSSTLGGLSLTENYLFALKMLELLFSGTCHMRSMTSNIFLNLTSMTYLLTRLIDETILVIYEPSFFDVGFTTYI